MELAEEGARLTVAEADRAAVLGQVVERRLTQREAAVRLGLSVRQVKRLAQRYRERGAPGLASTRRGRRPNNAIDAAVWREILDLVRELLPGLRSDLRAREAGRGARPPVVGGDVARLDDRGRALAGEGAP